MKNFILSNAILLTANSFTTFPTKMFHLLELHCKPLKHLLPCLHIRALRTEVRDESKSFVSARRTMLSFISLWAKKKKILFIFHFQYEPLSRHKLSSDYSAVQSFLEFCPMKSYTSWLSCWRKVDRIQDKTFSKANKNSDYRQFWKQRFKKWSKVFLDRFHQNFLV